MKMNDDCLCSFTFIRFSFYDIYIYISVCSVWVGRRRRKGHVVIWKLTSLSFSSLWTHFACDVIVVLWLIRFAFHFIYYYNHIRCWLFFFFFSCVCVCVPEWNALEKLFILYNIHLIGNFCHIFTISSLTLLHVCTRAERTNSQHCVLEIFTCTLIISASRSKKKVKLVRCKMVLWDALKVI